MTEYVLQDDEGYRHLPNELVLAIGRIVVIAGSIEGVAHHLIEVLGVDDARAMSFESLLERIKKKVRDVGVPECGQWEPETQGTDPPMVHSCKGCSLGAAQVATFLFLFPPSLESDDRRSRAHSTARRTSYDHERARESPAGT
jgi:hypothetical protein